MIRSALRNVAINCLYRKSQLMGEISSITADRIQLLMFHDLSAEDEPEFAEILADLAIHHTFISYSDAIQRLQTGEIEKPYIAVSFDDGFASAMRASAILSRWQIKACFFVCPLMLMEHDPHKVDEFCRNRLRTNPNRFLTWNDIEHLLREGHEIGNHTLTHPRLSDLAASNLDQEIGYSTDILRRRVGQIRHFAWPFGLFKHFSPEAARAVQRAGFLSAASGERGCHTGRSKDGLICVRRDRIEPKWPRAHIRYFLSRNVSSRCVGPGSTWPKGWPA